MDVDEVLIRLWDGGIDSIVTPEDVVPASDVRRARSLVGVVDPGTMRTAEYWRERLGLDEGTWQQTEETLGIGTTEGARKLPRGAVAKLKRFERQRFGMTLDSSPSMVQPIAPDFEPLIWRSIGHEGNVVRLDVDEVTAVHFTLVRTFKDESDPISPPGVRSDHLLASAVYRQSTANGDIEKYPTAEMSAAALFHSLVVDHPFFNGNKRTAVVAAACLLYENRLRLTCSEDELFKVVIETAQGSLIDPRAPDLADREVVHLAEWFIRNTRRIDRRSRVMTWLKFKRVLRSFDVTWDFANVGNRINLYREYEETTGFLKRKRSVSLRTQVAYLDDGRDVPRNIVEKVRVDLHLDELHGVDAGVFFDHKEQAEDVIVAYQGTLRRLART